jgi:hypothetical protein
MAIRSPLAASSTKPIHNPRRAFRCSRIPILGWGFGGKSFSKERTELIVFMTPRVIFDTKEITEASEELKSRMRRLRKIVKE